MMAMRNGDSLARRPAISICAVNRVNLTAGGMCPRERAREGAWLVSALRVSVSVDGGLVRRSSAACTVTVITTI